MALTVRDNGRPFELIGGLSVMNKDVWSRWIIAVITAFCVWPAPVAAQDRPADEPNPPWKAELSKLPTPRTADGKPDLNGIWLRARHWVDVRLGPNNAPGAVPLQDASGNVAT